MTPHDTYSISIHVRTVTLVRIIHEQKDKILLSNEQDSNGNRDVIQLCQKPSVQFN